MKCLVTVPTLIFLIIGSCLYAQQDSDTGSVDPELLELERIANSGAATGVDWGNLGQRYLGISRFDDAIGAFRKYTDMNPEVANAWSMLGLCYHFAGKYDEAIEAYETAEKNAGFPQIIRYNLACAYSLNGDKDKAFEWLGLAMDAGFTNTELIRTDTDLNNIRDDARFAEFPKLAEMNARPCEFNELYRELDFWIGTWDVFTPGGFLAGRNVVEKDFNGCTIHEMWTSTGGAFTGGSYNYFDPAAGHWKQKWVDSGGSIMEMDGRIVDGTMSFSGKTTDKNGKSELTRMSLTPNSDGSVRQFIERSRDGGETWLLYFEGNYVKAEEGQ